MATARVPRLLNLVMLLQRGQPRTAQQLALELGISRRTLFRDLKILEQAGIPCFYDAQGGYRIARGFFLPPISLTVAETLSLMLLGKMVSSQRRRPLGSAGLSAIQKLTATVPDPIRAVCQDLMTHVSIDPGATTDSADEDAHYLTLHRCIDEGRACRVEYQSPTARHSVDGEVEPYALHFANRAWYLLARSVSHDEVRLFKLARLRVIEPLERLFPRTTVTVQDKLGLAWSLIPEGRIYDVELEFSPMVGVNVSEVRWHPTQQHTLLPDGRCRMTFRVDGLGEIAWWLCGYAGQVKVLAPPELRTRLVQMHESALRHLQASGTPEAAAPEVVVLPENTAAFEQSH
jgi:proteasome accessory factor B